MVGILLAMLVSLTPSGLSPGWGESCSPGPAAERPVVHTIGGMVRVDNRCNHQDALVIVYEMYENSSETFWVPPRGSVGPGGRLSGCGAGRWPTGYPCGR
jgi:hypothetical protein